MSSTMRFDVWQDSNGVPVLDVSSGLAVPTSALPAGSILQVVSTTKTDTFSSSSTSFTDITGLAVTITPSSASNKILLMGNVFMSTITDDGSYIRFSGGNSTNYVGDAASNRTRAVSVLRRRTSFEVEHFGTHHTPTYLDSPNTTSAVTYSMQVRQGSTGTVFVGRSANDSDNSGYGRFPSSITAIEVAG